VWRGEAGSVSERQTVWAGRLPSFCFSVAVVSTAQDDVATMAAIAVMSAIFTTKPLCIELMILPRQPSTVHGVNSTVTVIGGR
jgi:hypothetical protein